MLKHIYLTKKNILPIKNKLNSLNLILKKTRVNTINYLKCAILKHV
jgi:hypothetical protein